MHNANYYLKLFILLSNLNKKISTLTFSASSYKIYQNHLCLEITKNYASESKIHLDVSTLFSFMS